MKIQLIRLESAKIYNRLLLGLVLAIFIAAARLFPNLTDRFPPCPFHHLTGLPCPFCGSARVAVLSVHGRFLQAALLNPAAFAVYLYFAAVVLLGLFAAFNLKTPDLSLTKREKRLLLRIVLLLIILNWGYLLSIAR
ncbi:MAG: DUF2752 domain-containing protein [candidate division KSB1 bacterium]|nr:DUF2752 domain-containing protein [candidate division KSB1 bacterium]